MAGTDLASLRHLLADWERGDFTAGLELFAPDLVVSAFIPDGDVVARGSAEVSELLRQFFAQWERYRIEVGELESLDDGAILMRGHQHATGKASGVEVRETLFIVFRLSGDRIAEMHWHPRLEGALALARLEDAQPGSPP